MRLLFRVTAFGALALTLLLSGLDDCAQAAIPSAYTTVYAEFAASGANSLCGHSEAVLLAARNEAPATIDETHPAFALALNSAIVRRGAGFCSRASPNGA